MRTILSYCILFALCVLIGACKYAEQSYLEGKVFTLVGGDTLYLDSVGVDFYNTEKLGGTKQGFGQSQDFHQRVWSTKHGAFRFSFKFAPAESFYELTFRKKGYVFAHQKFEIAYEDLNDPIIRNQELEAGEFKDWFYLRHQKEDPMTPDVLFLSLMIGFSVFGFIVFLMFYGEQINIFIQDHFRNRGKE